MRESKDLRLRTALNRASAPNPPVKNTTTHLPTREVLPDVKMVRIAIPIKNSPNPAVTSLSTLLSFE